MPPNHDVPFPEGIAFDRTWLRPGMRLAVVGALGGIGNALCVRAREAGAEVMPLDTPSAIASRQGAGQGGVVPVDVTVGAVTERCGALDGLSYVSGVGERPTPVAAFTSGQWDRTQDVNLRGAFLASVQSIPALLTGIATLVKLVAAAPRQSCSQPA